MDINHLFYYFVLAIVIVTLAVALFQYIKELFWTK
jgi:hypothetical protein